MTAIDDSDVDKSRRPLPTPGPPPVQRPNTPVPMEAIPPAQFYGTRGALQVNPSSVPPPLPHRPRGVGSSLTTVHSVEQPPSYFPEPEVEDIRIDDDAMPSLMSAEPSWQQWDYSTPSGSSWDPSSWANTGWGQQSGVKIQRNMQEEDHWWEVPSRPGPGLLPPTVEGMLHDQDHTLFSVTATVPSNPPPSSITPAARPHAPPSEAEVRTAIPHPHAYYCPKDNAWVLISWKSSAMDPPSSKKYTDLFKGLPALPTRAQNSSCDNKDTAWANNQTHHLHKYERVTDSSQLTPPYYGLDAEETVKQKRRSVVIVDDDPMLVDGIEVGPELEETGFALDLYVCCQCPMHCLASPLIPGVIDASVWATYTNDRKSNPRVGYSGEDTVFTSIAKIMGIIEALLWHGQSRSVKIGKTFIDTIGFNDNVQTLFASFGFTLFTKEKETEQLLEPPSLDPTAAGRRDRSKLLRVWVEMGAWLADFSRKNASKLTEGKTSFKTSVTLTPAREMIQSGIGSHLDQIPREDFSQEVLYVMSQSPPAFWEDLGLTRTTATAEMVEFAYYAQCRCDPPNTPKYFSHLANYVHSLGMVGACPASLEELVARERSRGRFTLENVAEAASILGFGHDKSLHIPYEPDETDDTFIENAWTHVVKESWRTMNDNAQREADEALFVLAQMRGSKYLLDLHANAQKNMMNPERAYQALEVPSDVDDTMLMTIYSMRTEEQPLQGDKWRAVLRTLAEVRNSDRLRQFADSGTDPGEVSTITRPDWPRGLNQLGNTCYLNSLLQYFYTIKDLREAVIQASKSLDDDEKLSDDDLKRHRVGGRLVTRREILRSKKFVAQLTQLFLRLETEVQPSVTPTIELAKLALVTSKDEEEDEIEQGGTESSNDTDATLVDDGPVRIPAEPAVTSPKSPSRSPGSVLGKRPRDLPRRGSAMDVDSPSYTPMNDSPALSEDSPPPLIPVDFQEASGSGLASGSRRDYDVEMQSVSTSKNPPPLPARKSSQLMSDSDMMFGKQHDVAECMDNCMFQIETALLKFDGVSDSQSENDKTSVVKRLFYGKIRQNVLAQDENLEKEDLFSHLPVNVGEEGFDIYDGLGQYFYDVVDYKDQKVPMQLSIVNLPPLLHIQLQRVRFDRELVQSWKSQAYVKFEETIYMDRFMDDADPRKKVQSRFIEDELNRLRERLSTLQRGKNGSFQGALDRTRDFLSQACSDFEDVNDELIQDMDEMSRVLHQEIEELQPQIMALKSDLEEIWENERKVPYELTSVFIHRGSTPTFGHYFFYSRNLPDSPDQWFKYNDSEVSVISKEEVLADTTGSTANPYLLVFARKDSNVVDTVKRYDTLPEALV